MGVSPNSTLWMALCSAVLQKKRTLKQYQCLPTRLMIPSLKLTRTLVNALRKSLDQRVELAAGKGCFSERGLGEHHDL